VRLRRIPLIVGAALVLGTGVALAGHVTQVDPATVPTGFLAAHNFVEDVPLGTIARATKNGTDVFVQHARLTAEGTPGGSTIWHTHPGPVIVTVVKGSLIYEDANQKGTVCRRRTYGEGFGFVDPGFGHVHRAHGGPSGVDFYAVYILPPGSTNHLIASDAPEACA
jgi:hypothetical protein